MTPVQAADESWAALHGLPCPVFLVTVTRLSEILLQEFGALVPQEWRALCEETLDAEHAFDAPRPIAATDLESLVARWNAFMASDDSAGIVDEAVSGMLMHFGALAHEYSLQERQPRFADDYVLAGFVEQADPVARDRACRRFVAVVVAAVEAVTASVDLHGLRARLADL